jgi:hypothetical protein
VKGKTFSRLRLLHYAILATKAEIAHYFLSIGFDPNATIDGDWTPLHLAAFLGLADYAEMLLFFRAKLDPPDKFGVHFSLSCRHFTSRCRAARTTSWSACSAAGRA